MNVYFEPSFSNENTYVKNVINGLKANGCEIYNESVKGKKKKIVSYIRFLLSNDVRIYHINWVENIAVRPNFKSKVMIGSWLLFVRICHLREKKIVWTMHNTVPHGCVDKSYAARFYQKWINAVDMIVVHAKESADILKNKYGVNDSKICIVPHGGYEIKPVSKIEIMQIKKKYNIPESSFVFLYFGQIDDYKNIPLLISTFKSLQLENATLLICGSLSHRLSDKNRKWIEEYRANANVVLDCRFIPEDEVSQIFQASDIVVLPYEKQSMQNSGVAILAMCEGKPFIIPRFGYIKDIEDQPFVFSYDYENQAEHESALRKKINEVYRDASKLQMQELGETEKIYAKQNLDWNKITEKIVERYMMLLGESRT